MKEWYHTIGNPRAILILRHLRTNGPTSFGKLRDSTKGSLSTINNIAVELAATGLINDEIKNGFPRSRILSLTEKGKKIAEKLMEIEKIMEE